jgi:hypothetical protein
MSAAATLRTAWEAGISVLATGLGTLKVSGRTKTIARLAPDLRTHKAAILELLAGRTGANPSAPPAAWRRYGCRDGAIPEPYREAWERLQSCAPSWASTDEWRQAVKDGSVIFTTWGELATEFQWPAGAILDRDGLAWFTADETVRAFGPEHAVTASGRVFDR